MPRIMPRFDLDFSQLGQAAVSIARAGELAYRLSLPGSQLRREWTTARLESLYELSYLRFFIGWETFQEATFYRCLCGHASRHGVENRVAGLPHFKTIRLAELAVLGGRSYRLWHDPSQVISRCQGFLVGGRLEAVMTSHMTTLEHYAAIRHRIAHGQEHARQRFDIAALALAGRTYPASRPGRLLRDWDPTVIPPRTRLETIVLDMVGLAGQII